MEPSLACCLGTKHSMLGLVSEGCFFFAFPSFWVEWSCAGHAQKRCPIAFPPKADALLHEGAIPKSAS
eukprot:4539523-Amphidinium_carterae.1